MEGSKKIMKKANSNRLKVLLSLPVVLGITIFAAKNISAKTSIWSPELESFDAYVEKKLPGLTLKSNSLTLTSSIYRLASSDQRIGELRADGVTGLVPPQNPFPFQEQLPPDDPKTIKYTADINDFFQKRELLMQLRDEYLHAVGERQLLISGSNLDQSTDIQYISRKISSWNGDIFWAPASKTTDINLKFGDEVRSVFGPIPPFDVTKLGKTINADGSEIQTGLLFTEVEGNRIELKANPSKTGNPLEFEHKDVGGNVIKWTSSVDKCDKPSLAGGVTPCGTASRLSRWVKGNVEWIALARKTKGVEALTPDPYWMPSNPTYALLGYIGFNRVTGEVAFFDGTYVGTKNNPSKFNWSTPIIPPGGNGYNDDEGRSIASRTYDASFKVSCAICHDNKEPRIITPYIKQARVGYRDLAESNAFSLGKLLPEMTRDSSAPYRIIGSGYNALHKKIIKGARSIVDPTGNCTTCHGLTNHGTGRFASDAVGKLGTLITDSGKDPGIENSFRTPWALRTGLGKIQPWMLPDDGNDLTANPPSAVMSDGDWNKLLAIIENPDSASSTVKTYTEAPAPESTTNSETRLADPAAPTGLMLKVLDNQDRDDRNYTKRIHLTWNYLNNLGGVPQRDDVRFNVAIIETDIKSEQPNAGEYPTLDQSTARGATSIGDGFFSDGTVMILQNVSYAGHHRFSDTTPATAPRVYSIDFPAKVNKRYLIRVLAKRFCFDQQEQKFSNVDHLVSADIR
jgi:hypothetical protein